MKISIKNPCHEDWNKMQPNEQGAFCLACAKNVVDFTSKSIDEIKSFFSKPSEGKVCARFKEEQLQELTFDSFFEKFSSWRYARKVAAVVALSLVFWISGANQASAQKGDIVMGKPSPIKEDTIKKTKPDTTSIKHVKMGQAIVPKEKKPKTKSTTANKNCAPDPNTKKEEHILMGDVER